MKNFKKGVVSLNNSKRMFRISFFLFIAFIAFSSISSIWAIYIESLLGNDAYVGLTVALFTVFAFLSYFLIIPIIERSDKFKLCLVSYVVLAIIYILLFLNTNFIIFVFIAILATVFTTLRVSSSGILIEKNSNKKSLSKNEGFVYTVYNLSYFFGPLIAFFIVAFFGLKFVFIFAAVLVLVAAYVLKTSSINHGGRKKKVDKNPVRNFVDFFKSRDRLNAYILGGGVNFWWAMIYIFVPLYIIKNLPEYWVGIFLALCVVPLVLFEYPFSKKAGETGYKKFFFIGFLFPAIIALLCFFVFEIWFVLPALIIASIGLAMVEPTTEAYFFDISKDKEDQRFYPPYNTAICVGAFLGQIIPAFILLFFDFKYIFLAYFVGMVLLSLFSLSVRNVVEKRRKGNFK